MDYKKAVLKTVCENPTGERDGWIVPSCSTPSDKDLSLVSIPPSPGSIPSEATRITSNPNDHYFLSRAFEIATDTPETRITSSEKSRQQSFGPKTKLLPEHVQILNNDENEQRLYRKAILCW